MSDLTDLYQEVILDHNRSPRNFRQPESFNREALGHNPLCGDRISLYLQVEEDRIVDVGFQGSGCAISQASASIMTDALKGMSLEGFERLFGSFHSMVTGQVVEGSQEDLGKLVVFSGVSQYPVRVKCATLPWHTLKAALRQTGQATTE